MSRQIISRKFLAVFFWATLSVTAHAQLSTSIKYIHTLTSSDGLSQNTVNAIHQDRDGFIWIGTDEGLNRFDSYSFRIFRHSPADSNSINDNFIKKIFEDSRNNLWIGTASGLSFYDSETETFRNYVHQDNDSTSISYGGVLDIVEDNDGNIWVGNYSGLSRLDPKTNKFTRYYRDDQNLNAENAVWCLSVGKDGNLLAGTNNGIYVFDIQQKTFIPFKKENLGRYRIRAVYHDRENNIWVGTNGSGILKYDTAKKRLFQLKYQCPETHGGDAEMVTKITEDKNGNMLFATVRCGVIVWEKETERFKQLDIGNVFVNDVFVDANQQIWVGTFHKGLMVAGAKSNLIAENFPEKVIQKLTGKSVLCLAEDHDKNIWMGTDGSGLFMLDAKRQTLAHFAHIPDDPNSISGNVIKALMVDANGDIYAGTYQNGLNIIDHSTHKIRQYRHNPDDTTSLASNDVWALCQDSEKRIWIGTLGGGMDEFFPDSNTFLHHKHIPGNPGTISSNYISKIFEASDGTLWVGTAGGGIHRFNKETRIFEGYYFEITDGKALTSNFINEIFESKSGQIYISIEGATLKVYDTRQNTFINTFERVNLKPSVKSILEDETANFWLAGQEGISRLNPTNNSNTPYQAGQNVVGNEFNYNAKLKASDGTFYFGSRQGLTVFTPGKMENSPYVPPILLTNLYINNGEILPGAKESPIKQPVHKLTTIKTRRRQNNFTIRYAALDYHFPKNNQYAYQLEGFDDGWNFVDDQRHATYTNLPPGRYTFKVKTTDNFGNWGTPAELSIVIRYFWHETTVAWVLFVVLFVFSFFVTLKTRTFLLKRKKEKLEKMVFMSTQKFEKQKAVIEKNNKILETLNKKFRKINARILLQHEELLKKNRKINTQKLQITKKSDQLKEAHDKIHTTNAQLTAINSNLEMLVDQRTEELRHTIDKLTKIDEGLNTFLYRSSHDLRGPITTLQGLANLAHKENKQPCISPYFEKINQSCVKMLCFLKKLNETNVIHSTPFSQENLNWNKILSEVYADLAALGDERSVQLIVENRVPYKIKGNETLIKIIIQNLMENGIIFNNKKNSFVKLNLSLRKNDLIITVTDNGIGIPANIKNRIFDMFYRGSVRSRGNGLGLYLMNKAVEELKGSISVRETNEGYTEFRVEIPVVHQMEKLPDRELLTSIPGNPGKLKVMYNSF